MAASSPRVLVTDERQRPAVSLEVLCVERATGNTLRKATTGLDGVAQFGPINGIKDVWFRPMASRNQGQDGYYGHLRVQVLTSPDSDTVPPIAMMDADATGDPVVYLVFTTQPHHVEMNVRSPQMTIERRDVANVALTKGALIVYLYSSSLGGLFYFENPSTVFTLVTQVTILDGQSKVNFFYKDDTTGNPVLTASTEVLT